MEVVGFGEIAYRKIMVYGRNATFPHYRVDDPAQEPWPRLAKRLAFEVWKAYIAHGSYFRRCFHPSCQTISAPPPAGAALRFGMSCGVVSGRHKGF